MEAGLVPGRVCGTCNVCCIVPKIDDPELRKLPGQRCQNALPDGACRIYERRPSTCRDFFCGWRQLPWLDERLRPDRSGIFMRLTQDEALAVGPQQLALMVTVLGRDSLNAPGLVEAITTAIDAGIDTYLVLPGPPGYTSCRKRLNRALPAAGGRADRDAAPIALAAVYEELLANIHTTRPVVLAGRADP